jgi:hypothetical protein
MDIGGYQLAFHGVLCKTPFFSLLESEYCISLGRMDWTYHGFFCVF